MKTFSFIKTLGQSVTITSALLLGISAASATTIDLITAGPANDSGTANGTIYTRIDTQPTGTGVFKPFLRLQGKSQSEPAGSEQGYNADYANATEPQFDEKTGNWTHSLRFGDLVYTELDGIGYFEFLLDLDDPNNKKDANVRNISLDSVQIFTSATALSAPYSDDLSTLGIKRYDMDVGADGDVTVNLDGALTHGNGQSDMAMYILASNFAGVLDTDYVTFYSYFGNPYYADGSFEEWSNRDCPDCKPPHQVPDPGSLFLFTLGLASIYVIRHRPA